jgi:hypothetical protein
MPAGGKIPPHMHPGIEHVTVISGNFAMGLGKSGTTRRCIRWGGRRDDHAAEDPHYAMAKGESVVQIHGMGRGR